ncbi:MULTISPECIES: hypothetical protein [Acinetobacter]|uniref:hypothetical protein n=1 Tax=Acinetobacter TaxID=469 RepID=UPI00051B9E5E|nr:MULTISPECIES: hypothetical protein [Acinetobacter]MCH7381133.1 hypothetical protein [Acinetobacter higginsii]MCJ0828111.1 hypothetical protein [Acinetobacter sp. NIPH1876]
MNIAKYILTVLIVVICTSSKATPTPEIEKAVISEHKTYQDFKETFMFLIAKLAENTGNDSQQDEVIDAHWACVHQNQIVKMFNNNQKYRKQFDQEFAKEYTTFDDTLKGFQKSVLETKSVCAEMKTAYDKI